MAALGLLLRAGPRLLRERRAGVSAESSGKGLGGPRGGGEGLAGRRAREREKERRSPGVYLKANGSAVYML